MPAKSKTVIYPKIGAWIDLWFMRLSGSGLGNCFYAYFHAVALAEKHQALLIVPPWFSLRLGPILRGEASKRLYWRMFKPYPGDIHGLGKLMRLAFGYKKAPRVAIDGEREPAIVPGRLNILSSRQFTFDGLHGSRDLIRSRLLGIVTHPVPQDHSWGKSGFIALHVRLGDFAATANTALIVKGINNTRIPLDWYVRLMKALQARNPSMKVRIFSDGQEAELQPLLDLGGTIYRSGSDIADLLAMSSASILVGSNSTYSRWAAFLGDMPSIWLKKETQDEKPSGAHTPILYVPIDATEPAVW